jgi:hypothetical protein
MTLGRLLYLVWYKPAGLLARSRREGGPVNQWITRRGRLAMVKAAGRLPPLPPPPADAPEVCFLTGRRFWYQTAFCFWSLSRQAGRPLRAVFFDDGTFDASQRAECVRLFPGARLHDAREIEASLDEHLPVARFPTLRARRRSLVLLRKLMDVHCGQSGWRLFLDSDLLFFRRPNVLIDWLEKPSEPIHMADSQNAYGYSLELLTRLAGASVPERVNTGILGCNSDEFDWQRMESWCWQMQEAEGENYFQEQALTAMMLAGRECQVAPTDDYRLMPSEDEAKRPTAAMHHYVDLSKRGYFRHAWRRVALSPTPR